MIGCASVALGRHSSRMRQWGGKVFARKLFHDLPSAEALADTSAHLSYRSSPKRIAAARMLASLHPPGTAVHPPPHTRPLARTSPSTAAPHLIPTARLLTLTLEFCPPGRDAVTRSFSATAVANSFLSSSRKGTACPSVRLPRPRIAYCAPLTSPPRGSPSPASHPHLTKEAKQAIPPITVMAPRAPQPVIPLAAPTAVSAVAQLTPMKLESDFAPDFDPPLMSPLSDVAHHQASMHDTPEEDFDLFFSFPGDVSEHNLAERPVSRDMDFIDPFVVPKQQPVVLQQSLSFVDDVPVEAVSPSPSSSRQSLIRHVPVEHEPNAPVAVEPIGPVEPNAELLHSLDEILSVNNHTHSHAHPSELTFSEDDTPLDPISTANGHVSGDDVADALADDPSSSLAVTEAAVLTKMHHHQHHQTYPVGTFVPSVVVSQPVSTVALPAEGVLGLGVGSPVAPVSHAETGPSVRVLLPLTEKVWNNKHGDEIGPVAVSLSAPSTDTAVVSAVTAAAVAAAAARVPRRADMVAVPAAEMVKLRRRGSDDATRLAPEIKNRKRALKNARRRVATGGAGAASRKRSRHAPRAQASGAMLALTLAPPGEQRAPLPAAALVTVGGASRGADPPVRERCVRCSTPARNTPMMRKGPDGCRSLCNACGLKWSRHGIY